MNSKNGLMFFIEAWKILDYKKAITWGFLSSIYTGFLLLSINYISEKIPDPLMGYILKAILSLLVITPIFLVAYIITDKRSIHEFKKNIVNFYAWVLPSITVSCIAGLLMIFLGNIYILYGLVLLNTIYLIITIFTPYYLLKNKNLKESIIISIKKTCNKNGVFIPSILNILVVIMTFYLSSNISFLVVNYNINLSLILTIIFSLFKPLLYALPLFNLLTIVKHIKDNDYDYDKKKQSSIDKVGDII